MTWKTHIDIVLAELCSI